MSRARRASVPRAAVLGLAVAIGGGCAAGDGTPPASETVPSAGPATTVSPAVALTRVELERVLGAQGLILTEPQRPYRPAESTALAAAPRGVYQVQLPEEPDGGWIVVYELPDGGAAAAAAREQADWLASGPGRVQTPLGTRHVIRLVGPTVILFSWHPEDAPDPRTPEVAAALATIGIGVDVPS